MIRVGGNVSRLYPSGSRMTKGRGCLFDQIVNYFDVDLSLLVRGRIVFNRDMRLEVLETRGLAEA